MLMVIIQSYRNLYFDFHHKLITSRLFWVISKLWAAATEKRSDRHQTSCISRTVVDFYGAGF
jgi:hypothetical protein